MLARVKQFFDTNHTAQQLNGSTEKFKSWHDHVDTMRSWTPDIIYLETKRYQPLFVYDSMMKGGTEHKLIQNNFRIVEGFNPHPTVFSDERFELWQAIAAQSYPIALRTQSPIATLNSKATFGNTFSARIKGQLFMVRSSLFLELDKERYNGVLFHRRWVKVSQPYRLSGSCQTQLGMDSRLSREYIQPTMAYMYVADTDYWRLAIGEADSSYFEPSRLFHPRPKMWLKEPFYLFQQEMNNI